MTTSRLRGGSRVSARDQAPSVNLVRLAELLSQSINVTNVAPPGDLPFISTEDVKLRLNTRGVLERLLRHHDFERTFSPTEGSGFLRDVDIPPFGTTAKMGGRIVHGSEAATAKAIHGLRAAIAAELDSALTTFDLASLSANSLDAALKAMAATVDVTLQEPPLKASMVPVQFADPGRPTTERAQDIGRVLSAIETIDGRDWLELILSGIARKLQLDDEDPDDIEEIISCIRTQNTRAGSQVRRFLEFLEDEAMARVRMQVCMRLMEAVAAQSVKDGFKSYVRRVRECFEAFAGHDGESLTLDVGAVYGVANNTELAEQLRKALFYGCLPVWSEASAQLFERRVDPAQNQPMLREVSYRFRVNGVTPMTGKSAFAARLARICGRLLETPNADSNIRRPLAELVFLSLVIPASISTDSAGSVYEEAAAIARAAKADPVGTLQRLHDTLAARQHVVDDLASELIHILKSKSASLVAAAKRSTERLMVSVHKEVVDWNVVRGMASSNEDVFVKPDTGSNAIAWFNHIRVSDKSWPGSIASISVDTQLQERSLALAGESLEIAMSKNLETPVLPVRLVPYAWLKSGSSWQPVAPKSDALDAGRGVEVEYDLRLLALRRVKDDEKARSEQYRTTMVAALGLLTYITLWELVRRVKPLAPSLTMTLVRLQLEGKHSDREADAHDGNTAIYAVSQAIEKALTRELPVKLQGLTTRNDVGDTLRWRNRGALSALLGGQPIRFQREGSLSKVAVLTYVTRPCDIHPTFPESDGYLFVSRAYTADSTEEATEIRVDRMLSRIVESRGDFRVPHLILEEIGRLRAAGYTHIMMLSHHFGNRHIGRAAERHAPHGTLQFLDDAATRFPDVHLYPLRRDVFPATRLRKRQSVESGFEVLRYDAHQQMYLDDALDVLRSLVPIYTFATLHAVGDEGRPQSGFCTYFFDVDHRVSDFNLREATRANILGTGAAAPIRESLVSVLRAIHFMESEKPSDRNRLLPVLDPFDWATPTTTAAAGEIEVISRRGGRTVLLSMPAFLAHVTKVLHKEALENE